MDENCPFMDDKHDDLANSYYGDGPFIDDKHDTGWWFGPFFHVLGRIIPTDFHIFSEGLKPPTSRVD